MVLAHSFVHVNSTMVDVFCETVVLTGIMYFNVVTSINEMRYIYHHHLNVYVATDTTSKLHECMAYHILI